MTVLRTSSLAAAALAATLLACSSGGPAGPSLGANPLPDFGLVDVNETSATFGLSVSPRSYLGQGSAWYFGHAT